MGERCAILLLGKPWFSEGLRPAFLHGKTRVFPTPFLFDSAQYLSRQNDATRKSGFHFVCGVCIILFGLILSKIRTDLPSHSGSHSPYLGMTTLRFQICLSFLAILTLLPPNSKPYFTPLRPHSTLVLFPTKSSSGGLARRPAGRLA